MLDLTPEDIGVDIAQFPTLRKEQLEAWEFVMSNDTRVSALAMPPGAGKSLMAWGLANLMGLRSVFVTATKGLQEQYKRDFGRYGMVDIRGRKNYQCQDFDHLDCQGGASLGCRYLKGNGCTYDSAKFKARNHSPIVTNYDYWMAVNDKASGLERTNKEAEECGDNPIELVVFDEAHNKVAEYVSCRLYESQLKRFAVYPKSEVLAEWVQFATDVVDVLAAEIVVMNAALIKLGPKANAGQLDTLHGIQRLHSTLMRLKYAQGDDWVVEKEEGGRFGRLWKFDVIWPGRYAEQYLMCSIPKVVFMSATLKQKHLYLNGVKKENFKHKAWPRIFPAKRHPIYLCTAKKSNGGSVQVDRKTTDDDMARLIRFVDHEILKPRQDRKGIIQTVSYNLQKWVLDQSEYAKYMIGNTGEPDSETAHEAAEKYRASDPPCILVGPSFSTGWDFPGPDCEFIIILKVPFMVSQSKVVKARMAKDPQYGDFVPMQTMEQSSGRGMRFMMDQCEVIIVDGHAEWFLYKARSMAQDWFVPSIRRVSQVPAPPPRLWSPVKK